MNTAKKQWEQEKVVNNDTLLFTKTVSLKSKPIMKNRAFKPN